MLNIGTLEVQGLLFLDEEHPIYSTVRQRFTKLRSSFLFYKDHSVVVASTVGDRLGFPLWFPSSLKTPEGFLESSFVVFRVCRSRVSLHGDGPGFRQG